VWGIQGLRKDETIDAAIAKTVDFFNSVGVSTRLGYYNITPSGCQKQWDELESAALNEESINPSVKKKSKKYWFSLREVSPIAKKSPIY